MGNLPNFYWVKKTFHQQKVLELIKMAMQRAFLQTFKLPSLSYQCMRAMSTGDMGSGSGKGGGGGGSIRSAGGKMGEMEAAREEEYFRKLQARQLAELKNSMAKSIEFHKEQLEDHEKAIKHHKEKLEELAKLAKSE